MNAPPPPGFRFHEVQELLACYASSGFIFTDSPDQPGPALASYLRVVSREPDRAATVISQLDDLLTVGLFSEEISDDIDLLPRIMPPPGMSVEDCLRIARNHISYALQYPEVVAASTPQSGWEWRKVFPALHELLAVSFNQDFASLYSSRDEALDAYLADALESDLRRVIAEVPELLSMAPSDDDLELAATELGLEITPPQRLALRQWLLAIRSTCEQALSHRYS